eukprot:15736291-Heterocapsa_arctica.AAC.1
MPADVEDITEPVAANNVEAPTPIAPISVPPAGHPSGASNAIGWKAANAVSLLCDGRWLRGRRPANFAVTEPVADCKAKAEEEDSAKDAVEAAVEANVAEFPLNHVAPVLPMAAPDSIAAYDLDLHADDIDATQA